ncbi:hypothetical protein PACTADRAFT_51399 [Pachysolen tannophilus NRRL Y-2460]|uniref:DUS-like FMN-binding domain-containing protein n=1 Tax=Pachysolen tannophilus NRRL Y-2460 TaxID=669874 RepID=A0A1E4TPD7_PACTA|nr:hypothetical protein PACTADRAFT_51399 [Pachysolen tannophilus NRRL Y-2460]
MVRIGELPTRLLALKYGCDLVWGPEIIDKKILTCERFENEKLNTIDFLSTKNQNSGSKNNENFSNLVFRTYPLIEKDKLIFQMGTSNPDLAVSAAKIIINDVSGIDINAGCPKHFSIHSGMGAALLSTPELLQTILKRLVEEVGKPNKKPISVKIRLLPTREESLNLISKLLTTGISNLTLHCRTKTMRNREPPIRDYLKEIIEKCNEHNKRFFFLQSQYGKSIGCMIASAAELNPTCFNEFGELPWYITCKEFIKLCDQFENHKGNTKYCLTRMIPSGKSKFSKKLHDLISRAKTHDEIKKIILQDLNENDILKEQDIKKRNIQHDYSQPNSFKKIKVGTTGDDET